VQKHSLYLLKPKTETAVGQSNRGPVTGVPDNKDLGNPPATHFYKKLKLRLKKKEAARYRGFTLNLKCTLKRAGILGVWVVAGLVDISTTIGVPLN